MRTLMMVGLLALVAQLGGCASGATLDKRESMRESAEINAEMGLRYMLDGNSELAHDKLERALSQNPRSVTANHYMADLYRRLEDYERADSYFRRAMDYADNKDDALFNNYGVYLCDRGRFDEARQQFERVLKNPVYRDRDQVYENIALCLMRKPDKVVAESYFRKALEVNPKLPKSLSNMVTLSFENKNYLSSRAYLQRYLEVRKHTSGTLWTGIQVEQQLGDKNAVSSYSLQLLRLYPDSDEARQLREKNNSDR